jgi:hypothetical protein
VKPACRHTCAATALAALLQYRISSISCLVWLFTGPWCLRFGGVKYVEGLESSLLPRKGFCVVHRYVQTQKPRT